MKSLTFITLLKSLNKTNFHIINAAAGSGKTYTLVLRYLIQLLESKNTKSYRNILALTFTNKAVNEMKERILMTLLYLSNNSLKGEKIEKTLCSALNIDSKELGLRAANKLRLILFEYGSFDIITLDKFTHRIIRSFSKELNLPYGFEVIIDPTALLEETVNSIIDEVGKEKSLTSLLTDFSIDKVTQDQSWNIQKDLYDFSSILLNENDRFPLADLKKKTIKEHRGDRLILIKEQRKAERKIRITADKILMVIQEKRLEGNDFIRGTLPKHFQWAKEGTYSKLYTNRLESELHGQIPLYKKGLDTFKKELIDEIKPQLLKAFIKIKKNVGIYLLIKRTLKSLTPISLLQLMGERLESLQNQKEVRLLGEFNSKISKLVQDTTTPFIYERLGERYKHYFLDEFQDTSQLQWSNLVPLISDSLESESLTGEKGSLLIVGDPKQAIYRWRGGDIQQFANLLNKKSKPFQIETKIENLEVNYRSGEAIVSFNNSFFSSLSELFKADEFQRIYGLGSNQKSQIEGGYVNIQVIPKGGLKEENNILYVSKTLDSVKRAIDANYDPYEIAILVRKREQASSIGDGLIKAGYSILSSESLVVGKSKKVQVVLSILRLFIQPNDPVQHKLILDAFWELSQGSNKEYHTFILNYANLSSDSFFKDLGAKFGFNFTLNNRRYSSVLEVSEYIMEEFVHLLSPSDPFLSAFLEDIFEFSSMQSQMISSYLKHWERQEDKLRITTSASTNAINVMTIHQSKGLEFPVVILPFLDTTINPNLQDKIWYPFQEGPLSTIQWGWVNASKEMQLYGDIGDSLYNQHILAQQFDAVNVLYVAMTRAKEQLYIISKEVITAGTSSYSYLLDNFVQLQGKKLDSLTSFEWGAFKEKKQNKKHLKELEVEVERLQIQQSISTQWRKRLVVSSSLNTQTRLAQIKGLLIHEILSKVVYADMLQKVLEETFNNKLVQKNQDYICNKVRQVIEHPMLSKYFERDQSVFCEQDVLVPNGDTLRPDRVNILNDGSAVIIDYKTGEPKEADGLQVDKYVQIYLELGYLHVEKLLVYINDEIFVIN